MPVHTKTVTVPNRGTGYPDFQVNIRPLDSEDTPYPNIGLPYGDTIIKSGDLQAIALNTQLTIEWDADGGSNPSQTGWGAGKDFYMEELMIILHSETEPCASDNQGILITFYSETYVYILIDSTTCVNKVIYRGDTGTYTICLTYQLALTKIDSEESVAILVDNFTGVNITGCAVWIHGMAI